MKTRLVVLSLATALLSSCGAKGPDPVVIDPQHYKLEFEDDRVRVLHVTVGPHEKTPLHYHPDNIVIAITANRGRTINADGTLREIAENEVGAGANSGGLHGIENVSDEVMERYVVELKTR